MKQEAYVSFEVAKLLKEKGFDQETTKRYNPSGELYYCLNSLIETDADEQA